MLSWKILLYISALAQPHTNSGIPHLTRYFWHDGLTYSKLTKSSFPFLFVTHKMCDKLPALHKLMVHVYCQNTTSCVLTIYIYTINLFLLFDNTTGMTHLKFPALLLTHTTLYVASCKSCVINLTFHRTQR